MECVPVLNRNRNYDNFNPFLHKHDLYMTRVLTLSQTQTAGGWFVCCHEASSDWLKATLYKTFCPTNLHEATQTTSVFEMLGTHFV